MFLLAAAPAQVAFLYDSFETYTNGTMFIFYKGGCWRKKRSHGLATAATGRRAIPVAADASRWLFSGCAKRKSHGLATAATGRGTLLP